MATKVCVPHCQTAFILNSIEKEIKSTQADKEEHVMMTKKNLKEEEEPSKNQSSLPPVEEVNTEYCYKKCKQINYQYGI